MLSFRAIVMGEAIIRFYDIQNCFIEANLQSGKVLNQTISALLQLDW